MSSRKSCCEENLKRDDNLCHPRIQFDTLSACLTTLFPLCYTHVASIGWVDVNYKLGTLWTEATNARKVGDCWRNLGTEQRTIFNR